MINISEMIASPDEDIISNILQGNSSVFELIMRRYNAQLYKLARGYGFSHQDCEDLMQETYLSAYSKLSQFQRRSSLKTWISKIMINKCLYKLQYGHGTREILDDGTFQHSNIAHMSSPQGLPQQMARKEFAKVLETTLQELPVHYRIVFILREVEGYSVLETADLLDITPVNVKVRAGRAKAILHKKLESFYSTSDVYEFNLVYCDKLVERVMEKINDMTQ